MAATTPTINLTLPATSENYSITILNNNFTTIDTAVQDIYDKIDDVAAVVDDSITGTSTTYSSSYIDAAFADIQVELNTKLSSIPKASTTTLGGIKLYARPVGGVMTNSSGLAYGSGGNGGLYVTTKSERGIMRDGSGQIQINPATAAEVAAGAEGYKPVTPATLAAELDRRGGLSGQAYSITPQQIGTWIDGTPIWRVAIDITLSASDFDNGFYMLTEYDLGVRITDEIPVIVNSSFRCYEPIYHDSNQNSLSELVESYKVVVTDRTYTNLVGYIEFVTPEDNIRR